MTPRILLVELPFYTFLNDLAIITDINMKSKINKYNLTENCILTDSNVIVPYGGL